MQLPQLPSERMRTRKQEFNMLISLSGASLRPGETERTLLCPACKGGGTQEKSFSMSRKENVILYKCFRASCGIHGKIDVHGTLGNLAVKEEVQETVHKRLGRPFGLPLQRVENTTPLSAYGLVVEELDMYGVRYCKEEDRFAFPVYSPIRAQRGVMMRNFNAESKFQKWDAYPDVAGDSMGPWCSWYMHSKTLASHSPVVVVEDQISAIKVSRQFRTCSLLGTVLNIDKILEVIRVAKDSKIVLALDKDATEKAISYMHEFAFYSAGRIRMAMLGKDLKCESDAEILKILLPEV